MQTTQTTENPTLLREKVTSTALCCLLHFCCTVMYCIVCDFGFVVCVGKHVLDELKALIRNSDILECDDADWPEPGNFPLSSMTQHQTTILKLKQDKNWKSS